MPNLTYYNDSLDILANDVKRLRQLQAQRAAIIKQKIDALYFSQPSPTANEDEIKNLIQQKQVEIMQKIRGLTGRINYSNQVVSKLLTEFLQEDKWLIVEGSDIWENMDKRCRVTGLYAINKKNKYFSSFHKNFKTQTRQLYTPNNSQYDESFVRQVPIKCKNDMSGDFYVLAETSINSSAEGTFYLYRNAGVNSHKTALQARRDFKQFTNNLDNEFIESKKKSFIETNWFEPYLIKKLGLRTEDALYGGNYNYEISLSDSATCPIKTEIYNAIDNEVEQLRCNSFILK